MHSIQLDPPRSSHAVSPLLYGIFLEDINFGCDGGLNANMVNNYSFDGVYLSKIKKDIRSVSDPFRFWSMDGIHADSGFEDSLSANTHYARLNTISGGSLTNLGYNGHKKNADSCAMSFVNGQEYAFECYARNKGYDGTIAVSAKSDGNDAVTDEVSFQVASDSWQKYTCTLTANADAYGKLCIQLEGSGTLDLDCIVLMASDYWNRDDAKWQHGKLRQDLVQAIKDLSPSFMRFPGGCIVEGLTPGNEYNWKDTVGAVYERRHKYNLWAEKIESGSYTQSYQIGFYEYFCLCEDLGAQPLPTLFAGLNCQAPGRNLGKIDPSSATFQEYVVQNYLDLIDFAKGEPETSEWAQLRADMGHPELFPLDMIGVGNENFGNEYIRRFEIIQAAIHEKDPHILCVMSNGLFPFKATQRKIWNHARKSDTDLLVDEHSYHSPKWFYKASRRFDHYERGKANVYFGEYAANGLMTGKFPTAETCNTYETALAEAAFLTGIERNSDVVHMASYAPLLYLVESDQWFHNLIDFNPAHVCLTANYHVQQLFSCHVGSRYIPYRGTLPPDVYISATADENHLYIKLVNAGVQTHELEIHVQGLADQAVSVDLLNSEDLQAKNRLDFHGRPQYEIEVEKESISCTNEVVPCFLKDRSIQILTMKWIQQGDA